MSRDAILGRIRRGLRRGPLPADQAAMLRGRLAQHPRHLIPARSRLPHNEQVALFLANVEKEFGSTARVSSPDDVPEAVAAYLAEQNLPSAMAMAPHPELQAIPWHTRPLLAIREGRAEATDAVSVQHGYAAIAETGTLMLPSAPVRPTTLNLLADTEIVVLRASRVVGGVRGGVGPAAGRAGGDAAECDAGDGAVAVGGYRADAGTGRARASAAACGADRRLIPACAGRDGA